LAYNKIKNITEIINNIVNPSKLHSITYTGNYIEEDKLLEDKLITYFENLWIINGRQISKPKQIVPPAHIYDISSSDEKVNDFDESRVKAAIDEKFKRKYNNDNKILKNHTIHTRVATEPNNVRHRNESLNQKSINNSVFTKDFSIQFSNSKAAEKSNQNNETNFSNGKK